MRIVPWTWRNLSPYDHEARAIWDFVGRLDLALYYKEIGFCRRGCRPSRVTTLWS